MAGIAFPDDELNMRARSYLAPFVLTPLAYAKAQGKDVRDGAIFIGRMWTRALPAGDVSPVDLLSDLALACAAANMSVVSIDNDDSHADLVLAYEDDHPETLALLGLTEAEGDLFWEFLRPEAEAKHLSYEWRREGDHIHLTCAK